jgi:hypothetical protein
MVAEHFLTLIVLIKIGAIHKVQIPNCKTNQPLCYGDLISITDQFKEVLAGIRWSWQKAQAETNGQQNDRCAELENESIRLLPRIGLAYQPTDIPVFAGYANSFT